MASDNPQPPNAIHPDCERASTRQPALQDLPETTDVTPTKNGKGFDLDMIVVRFDIPNMPIEETNNITIEATFNQNNIQITSSRINVLDFKPQRSFEFVANPLELQQQLSKQPLVFKVADGGNSAIGYGEIVWPNEFLSNLKESNAQMLNSYEVELKKCDGKAVGTMQVLMRLQPKCDEYKEDKSPDGLCRNANKEINPNDILFVVGEEKTSCCCSQVGVIPASDSDNDLQPRCLDLSNFRAVNSQTVKDIDILASLDPACQKIKEITNQYKKIFDAIKNNKKENFQVKPGEIFYTLPTDSCFKFDALPPNSDIYQMPPPCPPDNNEFGAKNYRQIAHFGNPPPVLIENEPQPHRCCPLCKTNMQYLPKLSACPNCNYKPVPYFKEKTYDDEQSADHVLKKFYDDSSAADQPKCRCTCKEGINKPCAHCRIRKLCEDIFQPTPSNVKAGDISEPKSSDVNCVSSNDNRPFLTKIFSELKDIYDIEEPKPKEIEVDERCERALNEEPVWKKKNQVNKESIIKVQESVADGPKEMTPKKCKKRKKRAVKPASQLAVRSRLYDYELVEHNVSKQMGHKVSVNGCSARKNVPPNMGWLWNIHNRGDWKPGTIRRPIKELMRYFLKDFPADTLLVSQYCYRKTKSDKNEPPPNMPTQKPTLHVFKKNGEYIITMRPLKPREVLTEAADPYENMRPIQIRIVKNPQFEAMRDLKQRLKSLGFKKCTCHRPISYCYCRKFIDKKRLEYQCNKECSKRGISSCCDTLVLSDTSDSEDEFDFGVTPPIGLVKPENLVKINKVNVGTQYAELDWNPVPLFPRPPSKYLSMYQCAVGERKGKSKGSGDEAFGQGDSRQDPCGKKGRGAKAIDFSGKYGGRGPGGVGGARGVGGIGGVGGAGGARGVRGFGGGVGGVGGIGGVGGAGGARGVGGFRGFGGGGAVGGVGGGGGIGGATDFGGRYGGRGNVSKNDGAAAEVPQKKVNMLKYVMRMERRKAKMSAAELEAKRKAKRDLLRGASPPILCTVDRRGKPIDPCAPCFPCGDNRIC